MYLLKSTLEAKKLKEKDLFFVVVLSATDKKNAGSEAGSESGFVSEGYGSADPDPDAYQNFTDPQSRFYDPIPLSL
jgi:hypothetical protein